MEIHQKPRSHQLPIGFSCFNDAGFAEKDTSNVTANVWMELTSPTPFLWDGISNLVIAVDENTPNWGNTPHGQAIQQQQIRAFTITMILQIPTLSTTGSQRQKHLKWV